ncbi:MAG: hypothetical protein ABIA37_03000 [Candidatus Woesearchaeota archaeon]
MPILKIDLYKVNVERKLDVGKVSVNINNNISIKDVLPTKLDRDGKKGLKFNFAFDCKYEPDIGSIAIEGQVFFVEEAKLIKEVQDSWKKNKRIPTEVMEQVLNVALHKGNIQAIKAAEEVGLPSPLPMPTVGRKKK